MTENKREDDLGKTQELFDFLQGKVPDRCHLAESEMPTLTADQAWTVVWYLGNLYWQVPDYIERCDVCGDLFDSNSEGTCLDYGDAPYDFCGACEDGEDAEEKRRSPENPEQDSDDASP